MDWKLSLAGLLIGLLVGVTGMGGGSLMTPMLVLFFGFQPSIAIGTDTVHGAIFKSFGAAQHRRLGHVHARLTMWMLLGSAPFSILGVALSWWLRQEYGDGYEETAKAILGVALVLCGLAFLVKAYLHSSREDKPFILTNRDRVIAVVTGVVGGFVVGLTSVGSGTIFGLVDADRVPAHGGEDRRHGHLPCRRAPRRGRRGSAGRGARRPRSDRLAPDRVRSRAS